MFILKHIFYSIFEDRSYPWIDININLAFSRKIFKLFERQIWDVGIHKRANTRQIICLLGHCPNAHSGYNWASIMTIVIDMSGPKARVKDSTQLHCIDGRCTWVILYHF